MMKRKRCDTYQLAGYNGKRAARNCFCRDDLGSNQVNLLAAMTKVFTSTLESQPSDANEARVVDGPNNDAHESGNWFAGLAIVSHSADIASGS